MKTSIRGFSLIKQFEGFREDAYQDPIGIWTIGYGFIEGVKPGQHMTAEQADARLGRELLKYEAAVNNACTLEPNQHQFDALVCFAFNVGVAGMAKSSVIKAHNRGDFQSAARAFGLWNKAGGKVWPGLTRRRAAEAALYLKPVPGFVQRAVEGAMPAAHADEVPHHDPMPQAIDPERPMAASTINRAGVVAGGTAAVAAVSESVNAVAGLKMGVDSLGAWLVPVLLVVVVALCGYIVYERFNQRKQGWA